jgi:hypothetical protein
MEVTRASVLLMAGVGRVEARDHVGADVEHILELCRTPLS